MRVVTPQASLVLALSLFFVNTVPRPSSTLTLAFVWPTTPRKSSQHRRPDSRFFAYPQQRLTDVELPLLDLTDSEYKNEFIVPLPSYHLPDELSTLNIYGMQFKRPAHQMLLDYAIEHNEPKRWLGHIAYKPNQDDYIGAIGCTTQVLLQAKIAETNDPSLLPPIQPGEREPTTVLGRGSFRFIVKQIKTTFPFPVAICDELYDDDSSKDTTELDSSFVVSSTLQAMKAWVDYRLEATQNLSPLEESILEQTGNSAEASQAQEMAAVLEVFYSHLVDELVYPQERYYAIAMMAAEMANFDNDQRMQLLKTTKGLQRLDTVRQVLQEKVDRIRAQKVATDIVESTTDESEKELQVGVPELPPWSRSIRKGTRVEYFWNEEYGWCGGEVVEEPLMVVDELLLTIRFDDGEVHKLPFRGDEKVRWRPASS